MEELLQLVNLIEKRNWHSGSALINFYDEDSLETKFYSFLKNNENSQEDAAIVHLYTSVDKRDAFKMLKSRFKKKLYNHLHLLNSNSFPELVAAELNCQRLLNESNILYRSAEYELAEKRVQYGIKLAKEVFLTNEVVQGFELLQKILVDGYYNTQNYEKCEAELKEYYQRQIYEREATQYFNEVFIHVSAGIDSRHIISTKTDEIIGKMESLWEVSGSPKIFKQYHKVKTTLLELKGQYQDQINFVKETILLYEQGKVNPMYFSLAFNKFILSYACLRTKAYEEGIQTAQEAMLLIEKNSYNWFAALENYFLLNLHSKRYEETSAIIKNVLSHSFFTKLDSVIQERWLLNAAINNLLVDAKSTHQPHEVTYVNKDKKGFNVWLIILDYLTFLKQGNYELLFREAERIRKYISKHLDVKADPRYKLFLKLLVLVVKEDFDLSKIRSKSRYLYTKLSETLPAGDAYAEVEVVPFEHLWDFILETLKKQKVKKVNN